MTTPPPHTLLLTCEHGGNRVPPAYRALFIGAEAKAALASHRGHDPGALELARHLERETGATLYAATTTRLLADLNRSEADPGVWSPWTRNLSPVEKEAILSQHHRPHRRQVEAAVAGHLAAGRRVLHVAVHSFTPVFHGRTRRVEVGVLYDPARPVELALGKRWQRDLRRLLPGRRVLRNHPYRGDTDGLATTLRHRFPAHRYSGFELEVSQGLTLGTEVDRTEIAAAIARTLLAILGR